MRTAIIFFVLSVVIAGCAKSEPEAVNTATNTPAPTGTPIAFRNAEGKLWCPVMNAPIESEEKADGFQDYEGKRYYFCCGMCPDKFKENPAMYVKK